MPRARDARVALRPRSLGMAIIEALGIAVLAALVWAVLRGVLDLGIGLLALAALAGWAIGALVRQVHGTVPLAAGVAALAWLAGLVLTWLVSMAILPGSSRTFLERVEATPFLDWMAPQLGLFEVAGLLLYVSGAVYGATRRTDAARPDA